MYIADTELVTSALGTLKANNPSGTASDYWMSSRYYIYFESNEWYFFTRSIDDSGAENLKDSNIYYCYDGYFDSFEHSSAVRPRLTLQSSIVPTSGSGTSSSPYVLD